MFITLYLREIQNYLYSLRFRISFIIMLLVFIVGSISFITSYKDIQTNYAKYRRVEQENLVRQAENVSRLATYKRSYITAPRENSVVTDNKESFLPNQFNYSAYNVYDFQVRQNLNNPLINRAESLSWGFIVSMFLSFITLLFAFDAISGEKENRTLALVFSNPVSRGTFIGSKLLSIITVVGLMEIVGIILSLLILSLSGQVSLNGSFLLETTAFFAISLLFITAFAIFGIFSSVITRYSNVSLLISLCFWLVCSVVIPNTSVFWAKKMFPIPSAKEVAENIRQEKNELQKNALPYSFSMVYNDPFYPYHERRSNIYMQLMLSEKKYKDHYYNQMFRQFENTRKLTSISPIAQFDYINEALLGGGYLRFKKNWDDLHQFQGQFLQWFKDIDSKDPDSPHWYIPHEDVATSRKPVSVEEVPQYREQIAPFSERFLFMSGYLMALIVMIAVIFGFCYYFFIRYDVR